MRAVVDAPRCAPARQQLLRGVGERWEWEGGGAGGGGSEGGGEGAGAGAGVRVRVRVRVRVCKAGSAPSTTVGRFTACKFRVRGQQTHAHTRTRTPKNTHTHTHTHTFFCCTQLTLPKNPYLEITVADVTLTTWKTPAARLVTQIYTYVVNILVDCTVRFSHSRG